MPGNNERGRAFGIIVAAAQVGGAISPLPVVPIQIRYGWRATFYLFGILGMAWSAIWYTWFRNSPREKRGVHWEYHVENFLGFVQLACLRMMLRHL